MSSIIKLRNYIFFCVVLVFLTAGGIFLSVLIFLSPSGNRFSTSRYHPYAYEIAPGVPVKGVQTVLSYFELQKTVVSDGTRIRIRPRGNYMWKTYILKKGYRLYLAVMPDAEGEFNDTSNLDYLNYDIPILVDDKGIIINTF